MYRKPGGFFTKAPTRIRPVCKNSVPLPRPKEWTQGQKSSQSEALILSREAGVCWAGTPRVVTASNFSLYTGPGLQFITGWVLRCVCVWAGVLPSSRPPKFPLCLYKVFPGPPLNWNLDFFIILSVLYSGNCCKVDIPVRNFMWLCNYCVFTMDRSIPFYSLHYSCLHFSTKIFLLVSFTPKVPFAQGPSKWMNFVRLLGSLNW